MARAYILAFGVLGAALLTCSKTSRVRGQDGSPPVNVLRLEQCYVSLIDEENVPAHEAGQLVKILVREGDMIGAGDLIALVDDRQPQIAKQSAMLAQDVAAERADSPVDEQFARESYNYATADLKKSQLANAQERNTVTEIDLLRLKLAQRKAELQIDQAQRDRRVAAKEAAQKGTEVEAANHQIEIRQIGSKLAGMVVEVFPHAGEWVKPGDPVARVVNLDRLRVKGNVDPSQYDPAEVDGREVTVEATLARGRRVEFAGRIVFVSPIIDQLGFGVTAEVENRKQNGRWVLLPGSLVAMTVHLDRGASQHKPGTSEGGQPVGDKTASGDEKP